MVENAFLFALLTNVEVKPARLKEEDLCIFTEPLGNSVAQQETRKECKLVKNKGYGNQWQNMQIR